MSIRVEAIARRLAALGTSAATSGPDAQDAYRTALKTLKDAQKKLSGDTAEKAADNVLLADRLAIQVAQADLARAASALAGQDPDIEDQSAATAVTDTAATTSASAPVARSQRTVDFYA